MKKIFRKLHLWLSVPFGLIITAICFSGASLVFESELMELFYPEHYRVEQVGEKPLPVGQLIAKVSATLPDSVSITSVNISSDPQKAYQLGLSQPRRASIYVDQYTGEPKWQYQRTGFFTFMFRMHRWLLDSMKPDGGIFWGKMIVGVSTLMFVFILIFGIIIWVPRTRKALKNRLKISVRKGLKRFWYDLHVAGGIYAVILLLAMALTGLTWSFSWYRNGFYKVFGVEMQQGGGHGQPQAGGSGNPQAQEAQTQRPRNEGGAPSGNRGESREERPERGDRENPPEREGRGEHTSGEAEAGRTESARRGGRIFMHWQEVYEELAAANPDHKLIGLSAGSASISFNRWGNQRASDRYTFDAGTGEITGSTLYKDLDKSGKIRGWIYSIHVGSWGGLFSKIITFLAAVLGGTLPLTGYYLWIKKGLNQRRSRKKKAALAENR